MPRLWGMVQGEPYMLNPALGILSLNPRRGRKGQFDFHGAFKSKSEAIEEERSIPGAFIIDRHGEHYVVTRKNPKRRRHMARHHGARHMAWVRSFQRNRRYRHNRRRRYYAMNRRHYRRNYRRRYRRNPYPMAGTTVGLLNPRRHRRHRYYAMNRRRHYRRNPSFSSAFARSYAGLPSIKSVVWGLVGYSGTAMLTGFVNQWMPTSIDTSQGWGKYLSMLISLAGLHAIARVVIKGGAEVATLGGGIYVGSQIVHDLAPGALPGLGAYTPLHAYTPLRRYVGGGGMPQLAAGHRFGMPYLASQAIGASNIPVAWAKDGAMDILAQRFRRFN